MLMLGNAGAGALGASTYPCEEMCIRDSSNSGEGLLFYGNVTIPFVDRFPRGEIYDLLTTRPEDMKKETKNE